MTETMDDHQKIEHISNVASHVGVAMTGAAFVWHWLAINHDAITSACAIVGAVVALIGAAINGYYRFVKPWIEKWTR